MVEHFTQAMWYGSKLTLPHNKFQLSLGSYQKQQVPLYGLVEQKETTLRKQKEWLCS